jgi:hypothetical protein
MNVKGAIYLGEGWRQAPYRDRTRRGGALNSKGLERYEPGRLTTAALRHMVTEGR